MTISLFACQLKKDPINNIRLDPRSGIVPWWRDFMYYYFWHHTNTIPIWRAWKPYHNYILIIQRPCLAISKFKWHSFVALSKWFLMTNKSIIILWTRLFFQTLKNCQKKCSELWWLSEPLYNLLLKEKINRKVSSGNMTPGVESSRKPMNSAPQNGTILKIFQSKITFKKVCRC